MNYSLAGGEGLEFEVHSLYAALQGLSDRRKARGKRYELALVLTLSVLAKLAGQDEPEGMAEWVKLRGERLRDGLGLSRERMPHAVSYRRVLGEAVNIEEFEQVLGAFFKRCAGSKSPSMGRAYVGRLSRDRRVAYTCWQSTHPTAGWS